MSNIETQDPQTEDNLQEDGAQAEAGDDPNQESGVGDEGGYSEGEDAVAEGEEAEEEDDLAVARAEAAENYDRFLRATAELDNLRKRTAKVRIETREDTLRDMLLQIAPILDNLQRALAQDSEDVQGLKEGVSLTYSQFNETLKRYGLEEIEAVGQPFDPNLHEAILEVEHGDYPPGTVVEETEKGYTLNGKIVRAARVIVSKAGGENG
jgi:molecular chaperone GrpE